LFLGIILELRGPEGEVISDELHNGGGIFVLIFGDLLDVSDGLIEGGLGEVACLGGVIEDFVVEDGEIECKSESDRVGGAKLGASGVLSLRVALECTIGSLLVFRTSGVLSNISVVVTLHLQVEDLSFRVSGVHDQVVREKVKDIFAVDIKLILDLLLLVSEKVKVLRSLGFLLLLNSGNASPGGSPRANSVLVRDREQVTLLDGEFLSQLHDLLHGVEHVLKPFGLFGDLSHVDQFISALRHDF